MDEVNDLELLRDYGRQGSEAAFATLVARHINLVYSAAFHHTGSAAHAEEITQAVFIILARKAASLRPDTVLEGWLYQTTRLTALSFLRGERRRQLREQEAYMQSTQADAADTSLWQQLAPLLDDAMAQLRAPERDAIVLRYFHNKSLRDVGVSLGVDEFAAQKRISRALEKLRKIFAKKGAATTGETIAGAISANYLQPAPVALTKSVTVVAAAKGTAVSATLTTLVNGTMKTMTWMHLKFAIGVAALVLLAGGAVTVAISQSSDLNKLTARDIAKQSRDTYAALTSYSDSGSVKTEVGGQTMKHAFSIRLQRPNLYRVDWTNYMDAAGPGSHGTVWSAGRGDFYVMALSGEEQNAAPEPKTNAQAALASATGVSSGVTAIVPVKFFNQDWNDMLKVPASGFFPLTRERDEKIGGLDCFVITGRMDLTASPDKSDFPVIVEGLSSVATTLWIGKQDHLIHQTRQTMAVSKPQLSDAQIKTMLDKMNKPSTPEAVAAMRAAMESGLQSFQGQTILMTQSHENITVNQTRPPSDFVR